MCGGGGGEGWRWRSLPRYFYGNNNLIGRIGKENSASVLEKCETLDTAFLFHFLTSHPLSVEYNYNYYCIKTPNSYITMRVQIISSIISLIDVELTVLLLVISNGLFY